MPEVVTTGPHPIASRGTFYCTRCGAVATWNYTTRVGRGSVSHPPKTTNDTRCDAHKEDS